MTQLAQLTTNPGCRCLREKGEAQKRVRDNHLRFRGKNSSSEVSGSTGYCDGVPSQELLLSKSEKIVFLCRQGAEYYSYQWSWCWKQFNQHMKPSASVPSCTHFRIESHCVCVGTPNWLKPELMSVYAD